MNVSKILDGQINFISWSFFMNIYFIFSQWLKRELVNRYRVSWLGGLWLVLQPMAQVFAFTLVFHGFMRMRWPTAQDDVGTAVPDWGATGYGLNVLAGLAVFNFVADVLGRAPGLVLAQPYLVTKIRFPLLVLPFVTVAAGAIQLLATLAVLFLASVWLGMASWNMMWLWLWLIPVIFYAAAIAISLAAVGVFVRDIAQLMPAITGVLMLFSPIFYPMSAVPVEWRVWFQLNPVGWAAESLRAMTLQGMALDYYPWLMHSVCATVILAISVKLFNRLRAGFADVL
jgi:lipopolysaccharide transport system permease protein